MLTLHHTDGHDRERFIAVSDVRYLPNGPGDRPLVHAAVSPLRRAPPTFFR